MLLDYAGPDFCAFVETRMPLPGARDVRVEFESMPVNISGRTGSVDTIRLNSLYYGPQSWRIWNGRNYHLAKTVLHELKHIFDRRRGGWYLLQMALWRFWPYLERHHERRADEEAERLLSLWKDQPH